MKVVPLGTSSGKPTLKRNVSAMALVREGEWVLFDCGEGTQMQVQRAGLSPSRLAAIFITHLHGDHFNGLAGFLSTMGLDRRERPLTLVGPPGITDYLDTLRRLKILFVNYPLEVRDPGEEFFTSQTPAQGGDQQIEAEAPAGRVDLKIVYEASEYVVYAAPLDHRLFTLGYRVEERVRPGRFNLTRALELGVPAGPLFGRLQAGQDVVVADGRTVRPSDVMGPRRPGKIVAYCTDTRPCAAAVMLARDSDLLVHEATFTDELKSEAREFGHSTAAQAAAIALQSGARKLLLTHFSTRFPDPTPLLDEARAIFADSSMANDLVEVPV